jgi:hypothetical protein
MNQTNLTDFFRDYAATTLGPSPETLADAYDRHFLAAGPKGAATFENNERFVTWLRQLHEFNRNSGMLSMTVINIDETLLSPDYTIATVEWGTRFRQTGDEQIAFKISYILRLVEGAPKIIAYISHEDQEDVMRARGLL